MVSVVACLVLGLVLLAAAGLKACGGAGARLALATYGIRGRAAWVVWAGLIALEVVLGVGVAVGENSAAQAAELVVAGAGVARVGAIAAGRDRAARPRGRPRGRVGRAAAG